MWLCGYSENNKVLNTDEIFEDISQEHARKTVTIEYHPHLSLSLASIHPCQHANVMKKIVLTTNQDVRVDQYLVYFLKFMATIIPTIEYDYTM